MYLPHRHPFSALVAIPRSPSALILAAALFFATIPEIRVLPYLPLDMPLFVLAVACGVLERGFSREYITRPAVRFAVAGYLIAAALLIVSYAFNAIPELTRPVTEQRMDVYAGSLTVPAAAQAFFAGAMGSPDGPFRDLLLGVAIIPLAMMAIRILSWKEFRFLILAWTAGATFGACYAIAYCNGYISDHWEWSWVYLRRAQGLTGHPNILGMTSLLAFPGLLMLLFECRNKLVIGAALACAAANWFAVDYCGSRSAAGGVLILCAITFIVQASTFAARQRAIFLVAIVAIPGALLIGVVAPLLGIGPSSALTRLASGSYASDSMRTLINSSVLEQALGSPVFGVGYQVLLVAHNNYLQIWHAGGVVGLLGFMLTLAMPLWLLRGDRAAPATHKVCAVMFSSIATVVLLYWVQSNASYFGIMLIFGLGTFAGLASRRTGGFDPLGRDIPDDASAGLTAAAQDLSTRRDANGNSVATMRADLHAK